jgi:hypothetical protein
MDVLDAQPKGDVPMQGLYRELASDVAYPSTVEQCIADKPSHHGPLLIA